MLDYDSEDIDGMDDNAGEEQAQSPPHTDRWAATSTYDIYMVDISKDDGEDGGRDRLRTIMLINHRSGGISGAVQNHAVTKKAIPAPEKIILRRTPKTQMPSLNQLPNRKIGRKGRVTPTSRLGMMIRRTAVICHPPKTK